MKSLASGSSEDLILKGQVLISLEEKGVGRVSEKRGSLLGALVWRIWGYGGGVEGKEGGGARRGAGEKETKEEEPEVSAGILFFLNIFCLS